MSSPSVKAGLSPPPLPASKHAHAQPEISESPFSDAHQIPAPTDPSHEQATMDDFVYRGTRPTPMPVPPPPRISTSAGQRLASIVENQPLRNSDTAGAGGNLSNSSHARRFFGQPPRASEDKRPPSYVTEMDELDGAANARPRRLENPFADPPGMERNKNGAVRGGWVCGILIAIVAALALAVGLGIGLTRGKHHSATSNTPAAAGNGTNATAKFPVGKWQFKTYLQNITTACTSNPNTWSCTPSSTWSQSGEISSAEFDWIIGADPHNATQYLISSTASPILISFTNLTLAVHDPDTQGERYTFAMTLNKQTWPKGNIVPSVTNTTTCFFNATTFTATLFAHQNKTYPVSGTQAGTFAQWPGSVTVQQLALGGQGVPECFVALDQSPSGPALNVLTPQAPTDMCSCVYQS